MGLDYTVPIEENLLSLTVVCESIMINFCMTRFLRTVAMAGVVVGVMAFTSPTTNATETLRVATTTSTTNSGLLDYLLPEFTKTSGIVFEIASVGSGQALRMGRMGQVDVVMVNAPVAEEKFVASGFGLKRASFMKNRFVIVGPSGDPADIAHAKSAREAMERISSKASRFVSRADDSGTHKRELSIWRSVGQTPYGDWYYEAGLGMKSTLSLANDMQAYTLTDSGTWLSLRSSLDLTICYDLDDPLLQNPYDVIAVNPARHAAGSIRNDLAERFIAWLMSTEGQSLIANFRVDGTQLFEPTATRGEE